MSKNATRFTALFLGLVLAFSLVACANEQPAPAAAPTPAASQPSPAPAAEQPAGAAKWDYEYDVVVVGYGGAGATSAVSAADAGASVLLLEKAAEGGQGGNTRVSGQQILTPSDVDAAVGYFRSIQEGFDLSDVMMRTMVQKMSENEAWLREMGATDIQYIDYPEFPEAQGSETMKCILLEGVRSTGLFWNLLKENVEKRDIDVWFNSPGQELVQDQDTGVILGVVVEQEGKQIRVKANNGVILACGGFENNQDMIQSYLHIPAGYPKGNYLNTGDGIMMAAKVGAQMWHMNNPAGPDLVFKNKESAAYYGYTSATFVGNGAIFVGKDGTRFCNEAEMGRHGKVYFHGSYITLPISLPAYMVFDEAAFTSGPVYSSGGWSKDNSEELGKGWIKKADTLAELAQMIGVGAENLQGQVEKYNAACKAGVDEFFGRPQKTLNALESGPYYALELSPTFTNTQGGPKRNENCEVLDYENNAIPNLYSAGELGSMYAHGYNGGGNLGECIASGRIAGENAAKTKGNTGAAGVAGKGGNMSPVAAATSPAGSATYRPGTYKGTGTGMGGAIEVEVVVDESSIKSITILSHNETAGISDTAREKMPGNIIAAQSAQADAVAGATMTSNGIKEAVKSALEQAK